MVWRLFKQSTTIILLLITPVIVASLGYIRVSGSKMLSVQSESMTPAISKGDLVIVKDVPDYQVGDVITYMNPVDKQQTITHRIVSEKVTDMNTSYYTKGDANAAQDIPVSKSLVVGKVNQVVPVAGSVVDFIRKPLGLTLIIYVPALLIMYGEIRRLIRHFEAQKAYALPGRERLLGSRQSFPAAKLLAALLILPAVFAFKTYAALQSSATLSGTTISTVAIVDPPPPQPTVCTTGGNNTSISVTGSGNVNISNSNNQTAQTGNATSTSGNATSGNATNCNSTNINVNVR